jgi:hypothetical protein
MKLTKKGCLLSGCLTPVVVVILTALFLIVSALRPPKPHRELPASAKNVQVYRSGGLHPDFVYLIKAELPEQDLSTYLSNLNLTVKYDSKIHSTIKLHVNMGYGDAPEWWDEPDDMDCCYFKYTPNDEYIKRVKWKDGWVYFSACAW